MNGVIGWGGSRREGGKTHDLDVVVLRGNERLERAEVAGVGEQRKRHSENGFTGSEWRETAEMRVAGPLFLKDTEKK